MEGEKLIGTVSHARVTTGEKSLVSVPTVALNVGIHHTYGTEIY